ncbi:MAG TPA: hypothetical protein DD618_00295 [Acholeplasmatales bacterium]|nr:hypothetical protein [Acholeplasmatales bacterium]
MYNIKNLRDPDLIIEEARELWNREMGFIYPISAKAFDQNIKNSPNLLKSGSYFAYEDQALVGFVFVKDFHHPMIPAYASIGFLSMLYVSKSFRRQGIGDKLLAYAEQILKANNKTEIQIGRDYHNFFPGLPNDFDNLGGPWLEKRGFKYVRTTHDLINWEAKAPFAIRNSEYAYRFATQNDEEALLNFMDNNFPGRWKYECYEYYQGPIFQEAYLLALDQEKIIAFTRVNTPDLDILPYNCTWHGRFPKLGALGPLGVNKAYRGKGLGYDVVAAGLNELLKRGCQPMIIDWTGLLEFYQQFGFEVWKEFHCYTKQIEKKF